MGLSLFWCLNATQTLYFALAWLEISPVFTCPAVTLNPSKLHEFHSPPVYFVFIQYLLLLNRDHRGWWIHEAFWGGQAATWHLTETTCSCTHSLWQAETQLLISPSLEHELTAWLCFQVYIQYWRVCYLYPFLRLLSVQRPSSEDINVR